MSASAGKGSGSPRLLSWDILRVLGIFAVVLFHATLWSPENLPGLEFPPWVMNFPFGASLLLTISGYFAAMTIGKHEPLRWWFRRLARVLPAYFFAVLALAVIARLFAPEGFFLPGVRDTLGSLALVQVWIPSLQGVDIAHWTVPLQIAVFTAIGLLAAFRVIRDKIASGVLWALLLAPLVVRLLAMGVDDNPPGWLMVLMEGSGINRVHLFVAGVSIYRWSKGRIGFAHLYLLLCAVLAAHAMHPPPGDSVLAYTLVLVLICVASYGPDWRFPWLDRFERPIRWLGGISFGVYLMHQTVGSIVARRVADLGLDWWAWVPAFFASAILCGWLVTVWVERPLFTLLTRPLGTRKKRAELPRPEPGY